MTRVWHYAVAGSMLAGMQAVAQEHVFEMHLISADGVGEYIGTVVATPSELRSGGTVFKPDLQKLPAGSHGFHLHQNASCDPARKDGAAVAGLAAGGHHDPGNLGAHKGPYRAGHLGDLPVLFVEADGGKTRATQEVFAPRVSMDDIPGRALVVHAGGDNYKDQPKALGGGGARIACGFIPGSG